MAFMMNNLENRLNKRERHKARIRPYDFYPRLESLDFENLAEGDRFFLQDFGIFNVDFSEDDFTLRLRIAAGRLSVEQLRSIAAIAGKYDLNIILTARAGMQLHGLDAGNILDVFRQINTLGLTTWQSFGDNIRNIVTDVFDGRGIYSEIETYPIIMQMQEYILKNPRYVGMLPRRISVGISGNRANVTSLFANDLCFMLAKKGDLLGFNVFMGGKNTEVAQDADIFLQPDRVVDFFCAFTEAFYQHGSRFSRSKTRLFYLLESIGLESFKIMIQDEYREPFENRGNLLLTKAAFSDYEILKDGSYGLCYQTNFARVTSQELENIAAYADKHNAEIRLGMDQNIYLLGLKEKNTPFMPSQQSATVLACAGSGYCPYSFWNIKDETSYLPLELINRHHIQIGFSGCAKGCGRHQHSDIGLIGLKTNNFGAAEGGTRLFLGAEHTHGISVGRLIFQMVPLEHLHALLTLIITLYEQSGYENFEAYSYHVLNKFSEEFLAVWLLANLQTGQNLPLRPGDIFSPDREDHLQYETKLLLRSFNGSDFPELCNEGLQNVISNLGRRLWTVEGDSATYKPPIKRTAHR
jgi:ferredoxin-nitrite reductase